MKNGKLFEKNKKGEAMYVSWLCLLTALYSQFSTLKIVSTPLDKLLQTEDTLFLDFLTKLLILDPADRYDFCPFASNCCLRFTL